jgi:hypothetical protein
MDAFVECGNRSDAGIVSSTLPKTCGFHQQNRELVEYVLKVPNLVSERKGPCDLFHATQT